MQTTMLAVSLIKEFEGFRSDAYIDPVGVPTIGFGTTRWSDGEKVQIGDTIGQDEAESELFKHVRKEVEPTLSKLFGDVDLQPNQRDALASFIYNLGPDMQGRYQTLHRLVHEGADDEEMALQFVKYRNKGSRAEKGLFRRRVAEALMWAGLPWERAQSVDLSDDVLDVLYEVQAENTLFGDDPAIAPEPEPEDIPEPVVIDETLPAIIGTAPPSPNTKPLDEVPYKVDPNAGAKPMEESERFWGTMLEAVGHFGRTWSTRAVGMGGAVAAFAGDLLKSPAVVAILAGCIAWLVFFVVTQYGRKKKVRGEINSTQALY